MGRTKKEKEVIVVDPQDMVVEPPNPAPAKRRKKENAPAKVDIAADNGDYKEAVRFLRKKLRGFAKSYFDEFERCWANIKDDQKKAQMYLDACKILMPSQSVIDIDIGMKPEDSFSTKLLVLRDQAEVLKKDGQ